MSAATTRRTHLTATVTALRDIATHLPRAERQWSELAPGMRAQSLTPSSPSGRRPIADDNQDGTSPISDPTGEAAIHPSPARRDEARIDELVRSIAKQTSEVATLLAKWAIDKPLKAEELKQLKVQGDPGCEIVGMVQRSQGEAYWEPVQSVTNLGGTLPRVYRLGSWALMFARRNGRVPTQAEAAIHCAGGRVMVKA